MSGSSDLDPLGQEIIETIAQTQRIPAESITLDSTFEELKIDSLDGINLVFALENKYGINIPDESVHNLRSVRETVDGVRKLLGEKSSQVSAAAPGSVV